MSDAPLESHRAEALGELARQATENPARFALGLTAALEREPAGPRGDAVRRRIASFAAQLAGRSDVAAGSALDQWRLAVTKGAIDPARLRDLVVPLGQAALAIVSRASGTAAATSGPAVLPPPPTHTPRALWLDPLRAEASKAEIAGEASRLDDAGLREIHRSTLAAARASGAGSLAATMRRTGFERAAAELAAIARRRGLALAPVDHEAAERKDRRGPER